MEGSFKNQSAIVTTPLPKRFPYQQRTKQINSSLSSAEMEVLRGYAIGLSRAQIAEKRFVSYHTIDAQVCSIREKLGVPNITAAVAKAVKDKLIILED